MEHDPSYYVRKRTDRVKMQISERAKQFSPFSALTGLGLALEKTKKEWMSRIESSDHISGNR